ncbi:ATP-binding cassette domain-containing protein [Flaviaesturariibacter flavus]|uniref:ATP-binding cassette domain-containing protein n=1 Tax=Flaviaesturariibacter flavus TaxID=2502780 RepID=UPI003CCC8741
MLQPCSLTFEPGRFHVIMGPNGAGKSTLLQLLAGELKPATGAVYWHNEPVMGFARAEWARQRAVLSQHYALQFPITVQEVVALGRYPYAGTRPAAEEEKLIRECLEAMQMEAFTGRDYNTLSGGEAQKVQMSRVLAQLGGSEARGKLLLLDEPVSHLDLRYQHSLLQTARKLCLDGNTVIAVLHDLNLALRFADRILFIKSGKVRYDLPKTELTDPEIIGDVFDIPVRLLRDAEGQAFFVF